MQKQVISEKATQHKDRSLWRHTSEPSIWVDTKETKPNTTEADVHQ